MDNNSGFEVGLNDEDEDQFSKKLSKNTRMGFIRKVYGILSTQLLLTVGMIMAAMFSDAFFSFQTNNEWVLAITIPVAIITLYALYCYECLARKVPTNFI